MKRDKFDELLQSKLDKLEVRPPDDMWARLEAQLPEIRRDLAFGGQQSAGAGDALPPPSIRRPLRRKVRWAYVAASVAAVMAMVFTMRNLQDESMVAVEGGTEHPQIVQPKTHPDPVPADSVTGSVSEQPSQAGQVRTAVYAALTPVSTTDPTVPTDGPDNVSTTVTTTTAADTDKLPDADTAPASTGAATTQQSTPGAQTADKTPAGRTLDNSGSMTLEEWQNMRKKSSSRRISTTLYAVNSTGTNNANGNVTSRVKLQKSSLIITDYLQYPDEEETAATAKKVYPDDMKLKHSLPLTFGAGVTIGITDRISIETGLTYTYLRSKGNTIRETANSITTYKLHYLGIPVKVKYDFFQSRIANVYVAGGGSVEKLLSGKESVVHSNAEGGVLEGNTNKSIKVSSLQASVGANLGVEFNIDRNFGLYIEPGAGYFFKNGNQPESYRTENPFNFTIKAGFRIKL